MPKTLLLADDSVTIQKVVGISFASEDIAITTVDNGDDAIAKARELRPDVVLADVVMPGKSGYEVCEALKADAQLRHIPVLLLTGTFEAFDEERAARAGAAGHVAKPFEAQTLVQRVKELLAAAAQPPPPPAPAAAQAQAQIPTNPELGDATEVHVFDDAAGGLTESAGAEDPLELDEPDAAFAFGDEDLSESPQEPAPAPPLHTSAAASDPATAFPDDPFGGADEDADGDAFDFGFEEDEPGAAPAQAAHAPAPHSPAAHAPVGSEDLAEATLLDPAAGSGFDVSSSDLSRSEEPAPAPETRILQDERPAARSVPREIALGPDPVIDRLAPQPAAGAAPASRPFGAPDAPPSLDLASDEPEPGWPEEPAGAAEAELWEPGVPPAAPAPAGSGAEPVSLSPAMRQELHAALEKIAWDAFGPVTEKIVQQALERLEQVAWEVVPKLAETLIEEEIRRLKGDT